MDTPSAASAASPRSPKTDTDPQAGRERPAEQFTVVRNHGPSSCDAHVAAWRAWRRGESDRFLRTLDPAAASFTFQAFDDSTSKRPHLARVLNAPFAAALPQLDSLNAEGAGVFVTVNRTNDRGRKNIDIQNIRALVLDLDGAPLDPILAAPLAPHIVCESSPSKYHAYWLCSGCRKEDYGPLQLALASRFSGDPQVHDVARVMRVPGFRHQKSAPFVSRLMIARDAPPYPIAELVESLCLQAPAPKEQSFQGLEQVLVPRGARNAYLSRKAFHLKKIGLSSDQIYAVLRTMNAECLQEPLDERELLQIVRGKANVSTDDEGSLNLSPEFSEDSLAAELAERALREGFRWSPGLGWMRDTGSSWQRDICLARFELARAVCRDAAARAERDGEKKRITSKNCVHAVVQLAQADPRILVPNSVWDEDPLLLNTPGGVVDLRTGIMRARAIDDYLTKSTRVAPACGASPLFAKFLDDVFAGDAELITYVKRTMGYFLTGDRREQLVFFWHGIGANGKSVLVDLLLWMLGDYALKLPAPTLMLSRFERHPTELAQLLGKRLAISSELDEGAHFNEALLKELSGDRVISARYMRGDFFNFAMTQKHLIVGNYRPRLRGGDPAVARRMSLVPFRVQFARQQRDTLMLQKLQREAPQILNSLIAEAAAWFQEGLQVPAAVREASNEYMAENDDVAMWIAEHCVMSGEGGATELYQNYAEWKKRRGESVPSMNLWGHRMNNVPGVIRRKSNRVMYTGVQLRF